MVCDSAVRVSLTARRPGQEICLCYSVLQCSQRASLKLPPSRGPPGGVSLKLSNSQTPTFPRTAGLRSISKNIQESRQAVVSRPAIMKLRTMSCSSALSSWLPLPVSGLPRSRLRAESWKRAVGEPLESR